MPRRRSRGGRSAPDARMLLIMNRLLPGAGLHTVIALDDGNPRRVRANLHGGRRAATMGAPAASNPIDESEKHG